MIYLLSLGSLALALHYLHSDDPENNRSSIRPLLGIRDIEPQIMVSATFNQGREEIERIISSESKAIYSRCIPDVEVVEYDWILVGPRTSDGKHNKRHWTVRILYALGTFQQYDIV
jgi:hypothetical protein